MAGSRQYLSLGMADNTEDNRSLALYAQAPIAWIATFARVCFEEALGHMKANSLSTGTVADSCGVDRATVLRWIKAGKLPAYVTPGGHHRVLVETLSRFLTDMGLPEEGSSPLPMGMSMSDRSPGQ